LSRLLARTFTHCQSDAGGVFSPVSLLQALGSLIERIAPYNRQIESIAQHSYPQTALLKQVNGVGTLIALTYMLTLEDPHRFRKSSGATSTSTRARLRC
jgi:hypothetical protein